MLVIDFFFFKQKTAYEMRISDWSSDVCSSDLLGFRDFIGKDAAHAHALLVDVQHDAGGLFQIHSEKALERQDDELHRGVVVVEHQIGRASCRERVCQYV